MTTLLLGLVLFLGTHSLAIAAPGVREALARRLGAPGFKGIYSIVAALGLWLIVRGFAAARLDPVVLYSPPHWLRHVALALLLPVFPLLFAAYLKGYLKATLKHPMLAAVKLWAFAHLLANGRLADVVLFGSLLAWAVIDRIALKRRPGQGEPVGHPNVLHDVIAVVAGLALYALFLHGLHLSLFGVSPLG